MSAARPAGRPGAPVLRSPGFMAPTDASVLPPVRAGDAFGARLRDVLASWARAARSWEIWVHLGVQDIKNRYKRSLVGPLWIAISLAVMVAGMSFLFGRLFSQEGGRYLIYLTIGMMLWSLISSSFTDGGYAFLGAESYIRQIPQAKQVYVLRCTVVNLVVFSFGLPVFVAVALFYGQFNASLPWALVGFAVGGGRLRRPLRDHGLPVRPVPGPAAGFRVGAADRLFPDPDPLPGRSAAAARPRVVPPDQPALLPPRDRASPDPGGRPRPGRDLRGSGGLHRAACGSSGSGWRRRSTGASPPCSDHDGRAHPPRRRRHAVLGQPGQRPQLPGSLPRSPAARSGPDGRRAAGRVARDPQRRAGRSHRPERGGQDHAAQGDRGHLPLHERRRERPRARVPAVRVRHRLRDGPLRVGQHPHPLHAARYAAPGDRTEDRRDRGVQRPRGVPRLPGPGVLRRHVRPAGVLGHHRGGGGDPAPRRDHGRGRPRLRHAGQAAHARHDRSRRDRGSLVARPGRARRHLQSDRLARQGAGARGWAEPGGGPALPRGRHACPRVGARAAAEAASVP